MTEPHRDPHQNLDLDPTHGETFEQARSRARAGRQTDTPAPGATGPNAPVPTGLPGTTTQEERERAGQMTAQQRTDAPTHTDPRREPGYAGYQSGVQPTGDQQADEAHRDARGGLAQDGLSWHPAPKPMTLKGVSMLVLAQHATLALVVEAEQWALVEHGHLPVTSLGLALTANLRDPVA